MIKQIAYQYRRSFLADPAETIDQLVQTDPVAAKIFEWLAARKLLHGVPFKYIVPDERMLPTESLKFFYLDINWLNALVDGAYSIGRTATRDEPGFQAKLEGAMQAPLKRHIALSARNVRRLQFKRTLLQSSQPLDNISGFLLRSEAVQKFTNLQVNAYSATNYPDLPAWDGSSLPLLRLERLSDQVLIGLVEGSIYRLDLHEPADSLHSGFDDDQLHQLSKNLRYPDTGISIDPNIATITYNELIVNKILRPAAGSNGSSSSGGPVVSRGGQVVNLYAMSHLIWQTLQKAGHGPGYQQPVPQEKSDNDQRPIVPDATLYSMASSDFALQMIEGVGMVTYYNDQNNCYIQAI